MSLKDPGCRKPLLLLFLCVLLVTCFVIFQQVSLLATFVLYSWVIYTSGAAMWYFTCGLKKLWEARRHGERLLWKNNQNIQNGLAWLLILLFLFLMALSWHGFLYPVPGELLYSTGGIVFTYLLLVPLLFSSIFLVRMHYVLERAKSTPEDSQSAPSEDSNLVVESQDAN
jgi:hypothetical protein